MREEDLKGVTEKTKQGTSEKVGHDTQKELSGGTNSSFLSMQRDRATAPEPFARIECGI